MVKRLAALTLPALAALSLLALAAAAGGSAAAADYRISVGDAKRAIRVAIRADFEGGVRKGSLRLDCRRAKAAVRCGVDLVDRRGRAWCGRSSARLRRVDADTVRTSARFNVRRAGCPTDGPRRRVSSNRR